ncbi:MAG: hypothetical protein ACE369_19350 [Roseovarius sp.]
MRWFFLLVLAVLISCGRPLTDTEKAFTKQIHGASIDTSRIRLVDGALIGDVTYTRKKRPRVACRERIFPPQQEETKEVTVSPAAFVLFSKVFFSKDWFLDDYLPDYDERFYLVEAMLFAHEMTHIWQWQNRRQTGYSPIKAAREHQVSDDPYLFEVGTDTRFLDYGYEQQASIVEEYVCCATLDPEAPRTARLKQLLEGAFPLGTLTIPDTVVLPWDGVQVEGICRV